VVAGMRTQPDEPLILLRNSPKALETELRFASRPVSGPDCRSAVDAWRDSHNRSLTPAVQKEQGGKVVAAVLTSELMAEYKAHRSRFGSTWKPLPPPPGLRELRLVPQDEAEDEDEEEDDDSDETDGKVGTRKASDVGSRPLPGSSAGGYVRQPALHGQQLAFVSEAGVSAKRISLYEWHPRNAVPRPSLSRHTLSDSSCSSASLRRPKRSPESDSPPLMAKPTPSAGVMLFTVRPGTCMCVAAKFQSAPLHRQHQEKPWPVRPQYQQTRPACTT